MTERCGTCKFAKRIDLQTLECFGVPPTPVMIGGKPGLGGVQIQFQMVRPRVSPNERGCAHWALTINIVGETEEVP